LSGKAGVPQSDPFYSNVAWKDLTPKIFKQLGKRMAELRKELGITQTQLAETLAISQQLIAAYEAGSRKIPASMLPRLAKLFAMSLEALIGIEKLPVKRGSASILQRQIEQVGLMPRAK